MTDKSSATCRLPDRSDFDRVMRGSSLIPDPRHQPIYTNVYVHQPIPTSLTLYVVRPGQLSKKQQARHTAPWLGDEIYCGENLTREIRCGDTLLDKITIYLKNWDGWKIFVESERQESSNHHPWSDDSVPGDWVVSAETLDRVSITCNRTFSNYFDGIDFINVVFRMLLAEELSWAYVPVDYRVESIPKTAATGAEQRGIFEEIDADKVFRLGDYGPDSYRSMLPALNGFHSYSDLSDNEDRRVLKLAEEPEVGSD